WQRSAFTRTAAPCARRAPSRCASRSTPPEWVTGSGSPASSSRCERPSAIASRASAHSIEAASFAVEVVADVHADHARLVSRLAAVVVARVDQDDRVRVPEVGDIPFQGPGAIRTLDTDAHVGDVVFRLYDACRARSTAERRVGQRTQVAPSVALVRDVVFQ